MTLRFKTYLAIFLFMTIALTGQVSSSDSLKSIAKSVMYDQPDEAISITLKLLQKEKKADEVADLYMLISNAYIVKKNTDSSLFYILKATNLINSSVLPATKIKVLFSVAVQYQQMEFYDKALESLDKAQEMINKFSTTYEDHLYNTGFINSTKGIIYRNQSNPDLALEKFKLAEQNFYKLKRDAKSGANLSINYYNMGGCFIDLLQLQNAFNYYKEAEKYAKLYNENILHAYALKGQGESFFMMHQYDQSLKTLYQAEKIAEPIGDLVLNEEIYRLLANNNLAINNIEQFQFYNSKSAEIQKTLEQDELKSLNRYLNTQNKEQEEINLKTQKEYKLYQWVAVISALCLLSFLFKNFFDLKKKNRRQKKLIDFITKNPKTI